MQSVTSNAVAVVLAKRHYYHTTFSGEYTDGWHTKTINFDKVFKYPPLVSVTVNVNNIGDQYPLYWQETDTPFFIVTTEYVKIAYFVRDSAQYTYDVNVIGELPD
jgi:hypothetical protein